MSDKLTEAKNYVSQKMTDAKDAMVDAKEKSKAEAAHAKVDAEYGTNKAGRDTASGIQKGCDTIKEKAAEAKHELQK